MWCIWILYKSRISLIDGVIGQVCILSLPTVDILVFLWCDVLSCGEPCQSLFIHVDPERADTRHGNIDPKVAFQAINQQWVRNVVTSYQRDVFFLPEVTEFVRDYNSFALGAWAWLDDPPLIGIPLHGLSEQVPILWQHKWSWEEIEIS